MIGFSLDKIIKVIEHYNDQNVIVSAVICDIEFNTIIYV